MKLGKIEVKRRVWVGLAFALISTGGWWFWTRAQGLAVVAVVPGKPPFVRLIDSGTGVANQVLRERAEYFDTTPLFFPTEWNYGQGSLPDNIRRKPEQVFADVEAKLTFKDLNLGSYGSDLAAAPDRPAEVLGQGNERPLGGLGQIDVARTALAARSGILEIRAFSDSKLIITQELNGILLPRADFAPIEFIAVVSSDGLVGQPALVTGSGSEEVDTEEMENFLQTYLVKTIHLGERLSPGRYRVLIGP